MSDLGCWSCFASTAIWPKSETECEVDVIGSALPAKHSLPKWNTGREVDLVRVAVLAEQYTLDAEYSCCGKAYLLGQRHYALYWNIDFYIKISCFTQEAAYAHAFRIWCAVRGCGRFSCHA